MSEVGELRNKIARAMYEHVYNENEGDSRWGYTSSAHADEALAEVSVDGGVDFIALADIALANVQAVRDKALDEAATIADSSLILLTGAYERTILKGVASAIRLSKGQGVDSE